MHPIHLAATGTVALSLPNTFGYVIIVGALIGLELLLIGFFCGGGARKVFTKEFMEQHFGEEHKNATGKEIEKGGAPDMGSGFYAQKLSYKEWYDFNNAQRAHYNFVEMAPSTILWVFCAGIYFPIPAAVLGLIVIIVRAMYAYGYAKGGPAGRLIGALGNDLAVLALFGLSIASGIMFVLGNAP